MDLDDGELMLRYARGDLRAFETLYQRHRGGLYRYLARHTRHPESANDLFQEVWSKVIASRERYEPRAKFQTSLYRIAHNCFVDHCRRAAVRAEVSGDAQEDWQGSLPAVAAPAPESDFPTSAMPAPIETAPWPPLHQTVTVEVTGSATKATSVAEEPDSPPAPNEGARARGSEALATSRLRTADASVSARAEPMQASWQAEAQMAVVTIIGTRIHQ